MKLKTGIILMAPTFPGRWRDSDAVQYGHCGRRVYIAAV